MKVENIYYSACHRRTYFSEKVVYESKRTQVIEWRCADHSVTLKSKHDRLDEKYNQIKKKESLSARPILQIGKRKLQDLLCLEVNKKLYAFHSIDAERLERDEILVIPLYQVLKA